MLKKKSKQKLKGKAKFYINTGKVIIYEKCINKNNNHQIIDFEKCKELYYINKKGNKESEKNLL